MFSTLRSLSFQREAGVALKERKGGPPSGGPSTTVSFIYNVLDDQLPGAKEQTLLSLYGIAADVYRQLGGGEAYLEAERNWSLDSQGRESDENPR